MTAPDETSAPPPRWPWLDRWFEPPWRALLTWVGLAWLGSLANHPIRGHEIVKMVYLVLDLLARALHTLLPHEMWEIGILSNLCLLVFWIEPLALRLNLLRGLVWLGLRIVPYVVVQTFVHYHYALIDALTFLASSVLAAFVLRGARTRPWMAMVAGALTASFVYVVESSQIQIGFWLWALPMSLPYAAVLLFGTRRLPR